MPSDNTTLNAGTGGDAIRDVLKGGVKTPVSLIDISGAGTEVLLSPTAPLPAYLADAATPSRKLVVDSSGRITVLGSGTFTVDPSGVTSPISAASLPLPTGASTSAKQDTGNTSLSSIDGKITAVNTGAVVIASGAVAATQSGTWTVQPGNTANTTAWKVDASSVAVPITDNSGSITVDNGGTFAVQATQSGTWNVGTVTTITTLSTLSTITNVVHVDDNSGSLTVDAPVGTPVFVRLSDGSSAISTLAVSLASVPSHAVTNAGTFAVQASQSGTWNVGAVTTLPARAAATDTITAKLATDKLMNDVTALTPKFAYLDTSSSGATQIVAAVSSKKLRVLDFRISSNGTTNVYFKSATAGQISATKYLIANAGQGAAFSPLGHFETTAGEALQVNNSAAIAIGVEITYVEV